MKLAMILEVNFAMGAGAEKPYTPSGFMGMSVPLSHEFMSGNYANPNADWSFQSAIMRKALTGTKGVPVSSDWTYTERNIIKSMQDAGMIEINDGVVKATKIGKDWYEQFRQNQFVDFRGNTGTSDFSGVVAARR